MINVRGGYEARNIDASDLIHNANPKSNYYLPSIGYLSNYYVNFRYFTILL